MATKKPTTSELQKRSQKESLELLYRISHEVATTLDLATVLERVLSLSLNTIGANTGTIIVLDEAGNPLESAMILKDQVITHTNEQLMATLKEGLAGWVVKNKKPAFVPDTSKDKRWLKRPDDDATGAKSVIAVPITARNDLLGVVTLTHPEPHFLRNYHLALIQAIADQAGIAVINARLYGDSERRSRVMSSLANSAAAMSSTLQLDRVIQNILKEIQAALEVEAVALSLIEEDEGHLVYRAAIHDASDLNKSLVGSKIRIGQGFAGSVAEKGEGEIIPSTEKDPRFSKTNSLLPGISLFAIVAAPIFIPGKILGVLEAMNPSSGHFQEDALQVLTGIGSLAGSFIQNAQLYEDLQIAHSRYHDLFENSIDPIIITDLEGDIIEANHRTLQKGNYSEDDLKQLTIREIHEVDWDDVGNQFDDLTEDAPISYESNLKTNNGEEIPIHVNVHQIQIADQCRLQWIMRDISERKKLDQLREDLTSMIFHDLRSPLSNVISSLDVIQASLPGADDEEIKALFDIANRSTVRIQRLTKSLLDINRLESGQSITNLEEVTPEVLIHYAKQALITQANAKKQTVTINLPHSLPVINADRDMLERVLINLFQNAIKYTPSMGEVEFGVTTEGDEILFWVQDSGPGVDPDYIDNIFDKYTRIHPDERIQGLGLGLAFCRLAVEGHGGRIWVENLDEGGARFSFTIPVA